MTRVRERRARLRAWKLFPTSLRTRSRGRLFFTGCRSIDEPKKLTDRPNARRPAVEPGNRRVELERVKQHGHAERWPTAGYGETNAGVLQRTDGVRRSLSQNLLLDERAVHVGQHDLRFSAIGLSGSAQASGRQARPSRVNSSSAAAGPVPPAV